MEEAGEKWDELNNGIMEFYICQYCGFVHLGRPKQKKA
jgi:rubrerythrin